VVDTAIHAANREGVKAWAEQELPVKRFGDPDDIARAIEMLIDNPYITASTLTIDGGLTAL
jgi:3-oxoacyl-[acyl-carrier protein] reductase